MIIRTVGASAPSPASFARAPCRPTGNWQSASSARLALTMLGNSRYEPMLVGDLCGFCGRWPQQMNNSSEHTLQRLWRKLPNRCGDDGFVGGENLGGSSKARDAQRTWQRTASPRPASASTTAGRSFDLDRSENGNRTRTTAPAAGAPTPRPPRAHPSPRIAPPG
jgi:hypothetical protein